ncbi:hypothetical protein [Corallococcus aberystwythensis]|uniref:Uncharacterized protein n=1 Tax=Corallococcus aberystwythensis TaxID=2316722 RepID=A0A3A8PRI8_9BACT|nr:hypothetical protein [Corallococcus aberystwythensis]RKH59076.1 hypothetical protein D7W81_27970 [Corallococcus aberystwythensis]
MVALALALLLGTLPGPGLSCEGRTAAGETFPTCFDPGTGWVLGTTLRVQDGEEALGLRTGLLVRVARSSGSKTDSLWFDSHRLLMTEAWGGEHEGLTVTAYEGLLRRHVEEGAILIPMGRPRRIPFPFDVALAVRAAHLERRTWEGAGWTLETGRVGLLLDPLRTNTEWGWLAVGPAASHALWHGPDGTRNEVSPFTSLLLDAGWETRDGRWALRATGLAGWSFDFDGGSRFRARGEVALEHVLLAVNDAPVFVRLTATGVRNDAGLFRRSEGMLGAGLAVRPFGER